MTSFSVILYLLAIVAANLSVAYFGPSAVIVNAFLLIGLDLSLRDYLHDAWGDHLLTKMGALIGAGGLITYFVQPEAGWVAVASVSAFTLAASADAITYHWLTDYRYLLRANGSNVVGAAVDSVVFPTVAFGAFIPWAVAGQFVAKLSGGAVWAWIIERVRFRYAVAATVLCLALPISAQGQDLWVSTHYDTRRQQPIASVIHETPIPGTPIFTNGFVEAWRNPRNGFPADDWSFYSKHWATYPLTQRLSVSLGVELLYNRAGVNFTFPGEATFDPRDPRLRVTPKIGLQVKVY